MISRSSSRSLLATVLAAGVALSFALGAALVTTVISAAPASAHAVLVKITPAASAQLVTAPTQVVVEFNEPVSNTFATVVVTNAAGVGVSSGKPTVLGGKVTQPLSPNLASGAYRIAFRVTSDDGHPVTGVSTFTLKLASTGSPTTTPTTTAATPSPAGPPSQTTPSDSATATSPTVGSTPDQEGWLTRFFAPVAGAVGLLVIGAGVLVWERQRR